MSHATLTEPRPAELDSAGRRSAGPIGNDRGAVVQLLVLMLSGAVIVLGAIARAWLPERFLLDDAHIRETIASPIGDTETLGYRNIAYVYQFLGLDRSPELAGLVAMILLVGAMFAAVHFSACQDLSGPGVAVLVVAYGLGLCYLACYSKEILGLAVVALVLLLPRGWWSEGLVIGAMLAYATLIRPYWVIIAALYLLFRAVLPRCRGWMQLIVLILGCYVALEVVFTIALQQDLSFARTEVNLSRTDPSLVGSMITDLLPAHGWLAPANAMIMLASLVAPWPLLHGSLGHRGSAAVIMLLWGVVVAALVRLRREAQGLRVARALALLVALVAVQAIFEPDYGSYLKHLSPMMPLFFALAPLRRREAGPAAARTRAHAVPAVPSRPGTPGLRILHVTDASASGVLSAVTTLARAQSEHPSVHRVVLGYVPRPESPTWAEVSALAGPGVEVVPWSLATDRRRLLDLCVELRSALRSGEVDIVHLHSSRAGLLGRWVARLTRSRATVVYSPHAFAFAYRGIGPIRRAVWWLCELAGTLAGRRLVLVSPSEEGVARRSLPLVRTQVLANGVDIARLRSLTVGRRLSGPPIVAHVGRISPAKHPALFAHTVQLVREQIPEAVAIWLGDGDRSLLGPDAAIEVSGWLSTAELHDLLPSVSVLLFTSNGEGMSMAMLEAQAMGIPVVASRVTGTTDLVDHGVNGYLGTIDAELSAAVVTLLSDPDTAATVRAAAAERATGYDIADLGPRSLAVYRALGLPDRGSDRDLVLTGAPR